MPQTLSQKFCTQARKQCEQLDSEYGHEPMKPPRVAKRPLDKAMEAFIENSFIAWEWDSNAKHEAELNKRAKELKTPGISDETKRKITAFLHRLKAERAKYRKYFSTEYKCTQQSFVQSVKFDKAKNLFYAKLAWEEGTAQRGKKHVPYAEREEFVLGTDPHHASSSGSSTRLAHP